ncbi:MULTISPECIES: ABC transporter permease [Marinobacter]|jgi:putative ABC transport system permease protein|uniref:ABC transport system permease protein n=3 Tax=Marinobacter TaxID=2742 RepID=W5YQD4_9GAMM|nr:MULTISPECIES: FtsX-like permease family protein [Marinobacter]AHI31104.1 ABC transporter ATP-binding protein [Marinobacter salarius]AZR43376.1 putative ABC transporter permease [Marinobacter salarius]KXJ42400.1 MAG: ABC transporter ATP-binding protein [Marinobacter sp. Hex_13]MBJ7299938.1 FtsX-like permease family protein [Marinobacter salarius]MBS8231459.1 ABC transporter ATP-binding protein [Marinobacter salarius]
MAASKKLMSVKRDWRERDVRVVLSALIIAVATVATIALFASQLQRTLVSSASSFLAADRQLEAENGRPIPEGWMQEAEQRGLETARMVEFSTMVFGAGNFQLVSVKAVNNAYPLRGEVEYQEGAEAPRQTVAHGPAPGEVWINPRLLRLLELELGDTLEVGNQGLIISGLLVREPDGGFNMSALAPRVMMHVDDVGATGVIQEGSRVEYVYLFAGEEALLDDYYGWLQPRLEPSHEWEGVRDGETFSRSLERAERFLLLGGSLAVMLAAVAVAVASRQYALSQRDTVALLKTLGVRSQGIGRLYLRRLALWGIVGAVGGLLVALPLYWLLSSVLGDVLERQIDYQIDPNALAPALLTALVSLFAFAYPPIRRLRNVPAMRVLRSQPGESGREAIPDLVIAVVAIFGLVWMYAREVSLVLSLLGGLALLLGTLGLLGWLMVTTLRRISGGGNAWRLALVGLYRHRRASLSQIAVFAMTLMLAATLILVRTSLLDDWQSQLPEDTPNHFLINIAPEAVDEVDAFWAERGHPLEKLYPMVRGRLTELNGKPVKEAVTKDERVGALNRELNLTWMEELPEDNGIVAGQWFTNGQTDGVSIEAELAGKLGVEVGDELGFTIGSEKITETVTSVRTVQWDSMKPNFYMAFPPGGGLEDMPATWITAFYLPADLKSQLNDFSRRFPTVSVLEIDHVIERIQEIVRQVTQAIEAILALILAAALVVMAAVVSATMQDRQREGALLRTLGGRQTLLVRSTMLEFALLGFFAGILGVAAAEGAVWALQFRMFEGEFRWHWQTILPIPLFSALVLALFGRWQLKPVLSVSPMLLLRRLE